MLFPTYWKLKKKFMNCKQPNEKLTVSYPILKKDSLKSVLKVRESKISSLWCLANTTEHHYIQDTNLEENDISATTSHV